MKLYLDDERKAPEGWVLVTNPYTAILFIAAGEVTHISLDHDLGFYKEDGQEVTGYDVLVAIENWVNTSKFFDPPEITIHTANISARRKMELAVAAIAKAYKERR